MAINLINLESRAYDLMSNRFMFQLNSFIFIRVNPR